MRPAARASRVDVRRDEHDRAAHPESRRRSICSTRRRSGPSCAGRRCRGGAEASGGAGGLPRWTSYLEEPFHCGGSADDDGAAHPAPHGHRCADPGARRLPPALRSTPAFQRALAAQMAVFEGRTRRLERSSAPERPILIAGTLDQQSLPARSWSSCISATYDALVVAGRCRKTMTTHRLVLLSCTRADPRLRRRRRQ